MSGIFFAMMCVSKAKQVVKDILHKTTAPGMTDEQLSALASVMRELEEIPAAKRGDPDSPYECRCTQVFGAPLKCYGCRLHEVEVTLRDELSTGNKIIEDLQRTCEEYKARLTAAESARLPPEYGEILDSMRRNWPLGPAWTQRTRHQDAILEVVAEALNQKFYQLRLHVDQRIDERLEVLKGK